MRIAAGGSLAPGNSIASLASGTASFAAGATYATALELMADRNTCSHMYRQSLIASILARLPQHCRTMQSVFAGLPG
ncbi:MAG: hypothetical protein ACKO4T_06490 [Planctomycetaceae bacterium]